PLYDDMTVADFLTYVGSLRGMSARELDSRLPEVLARTQLTDRRNQLISELSHGYRKRVGIAQAIIHRPRLVILDEPISGLDPAQIREMRSVIRNLAADSTVLLSSHNLPEISQTCDRILVLRRGRLVTEPTDTPDAIAPTIGGLAGGPHKLHLSLTLRGDESAVRELLDQSPLVAGHQTHAGDGLVISYVLLTADEPEALVAALVDAGIGVRRVEDGLATQLEDVFLHLTEEGA
ncbi:MAG: ABC transporter ATP-binding protein, partial [Deltaproteobacteria bacterium]